MPFALAIIGVVLLASALRGTSTALFSTLKSDFTGSGNYLYWVIAILVIGSIGYVKKLQPVSDAFMALLGVVFIISNKGFFAQFTSAIAAGPATGCVTSSNNAVASGAVTTSPTGGSILGNGVQNMGTSIPSGTTGSTANNLFGVVPVQGVTNLGTSF